MNSNGQLFIISGPSGAGKTTLVHKLIDRVVSDHPIERVVTYTTRNPRAGEINGKDYHFITVADFKEKVAEQFFIEWSCAYGSFYGSPRNELAKLREGVSLVLIVDADGTRSIMKELSPVAILINPPHIDDLKKRIGEREHECLDNEMVGFRVDLARKEMADSDLCRLYKYVIINEKIAQSIDQLVGLVKNEIQRLVF